MTEKSQQPDYTEVQRANHEKSHRTYHAIRPGVSQMIPDLLRSGVFTVGVPTGAVNAIFAVHKHDSIDAEKEGHLVRYTGPQLGQFHKRILLGLLLLAAGKEGDITLNFTADEFLKSIGRDYCTANVDALRRALADLRAGTFIVTKYQGEQGQVFGFVSSVEWYKREFSVRMDHKGAWALQNFGRTLIPMDKRNQLSDGLQTALADLMYATRQDTYEIVDLAKIWGREPVQLGRDVTAALKKLLIEGVLTSYERCRGKFRVEKAARFEPT